MKSGRKSGGETWGDEDAGLLNLEGGVTGGVECSALARRTTAPPLMALSCRTFAVNIVPKVPEVDSFEYRSCMLHNHTCTFEGYPM